MELLWKCESKILQACINYRGEKKNKKEHNHFSAAIRVILRFNEAEYLKIAGM